MRFTNFTAQMPSYKHKKSDITHQVTHPYSQSPPNRNSHTQDCLVGTVMEVHDNLKPLQNSTSPAVEDMRHVIAVRDALWEGIGVLHDLTAKLKHKIQNNESYLRKAKNRTTQQIQVLSSASLSIHDACLVR